MHIVNTTDATIPNIEIRSLDVGKSNALCGGKEPKVTLFRVKDDNGFSYRIRIECPERTKP